LRGNVTKLPTLTSLEFISALRVLGFTISRMTADTIALVRGRRQVEVPRLAALDATDQRALLDVAGVREPDFSVVAFTHSAGAIPIAQPTGLDPRL
jgi:hypothetical protein